MIFMLTVEYEAEIYTNKKVQEDFQVKADSFREAETSFTKDIFLRPETNPSAELVNIRKVISPEL